MYPDYKLKGSNLSIQGDADLRSIFDNLLEGTEDERPRGHWIVLQSLLRENGKPIKSPYSYKITGEGKHDSRGPNTTRTGFLCTEYLIRAAFRPASRMIMNEINAEAALLSQTRDVFFISSKYKIYEHDIIVLIDVDDDGNPINPITPINELSVTKVYPIKADNGRIEYYAVICEDQK